MATFRRYRDLCCPRRRAVTLIFLGTFARYDAFTGMDLPSRRILRMVPDWHDLQSIPP